LSSIRTLIADDYAEWRRQVRLLLQARPEWKSSPRRRMDPKPFRKPRNEARLDFAGHRLPELNGIEAAGGSTTLSQLQNSLPKSEQ